MISIASENPFEGSGTTTVGETLRWIRSEEGQVSLNREPTNMIPYLKKVAADFVKG